MAPFVGEGDQERWVEPPPERLYAIRTVLDYGAASKRMLEIAAGFTRYAAKQLGFHHARIAVPRGVFWEMTRLFEPDMLEIAPFNTVHVKFLRENHGIIDYPSPTKTDHHFKHRLWKFIRPLYQEIWDALKRYDQVEIDANIARIFDYRKQKSDHAWSEEETIQEKEFAWFQAFIANEHARQCIRDHAEKVKKPDPFSQAGDLSVAAWLQKMVKAKRDKMDKQCIFFVTKDKGAAMRVMVESDDGIVRRPHLNICTPEEFFEVVRQIPWYVDQLQPGLEATENLRRLLEPHPFANDSTAISLLGPPSIAGIVDALARASRYGPKIAESGLWLPYERQEEFFAESKTQNPKAREERYLAAHADEIAEMEQRMMKLWEDLRSHPKYGWVRKLRDERLQRERGNEPEGPA